MCPRRLRCQAAAQSWLDSTATKAHVWRACRAPAPRGFACGTGGLVDGPPKAIGRLEFRGGRAHMTPYKPGYQTSEFWGKNVLQVLSLALAAYVAQNPGSLTADQQASIMIVAGLVAPSVLEALYTFNRTWLTRAHARNAHTIARTPARALGVGRRSAASSRALQACAPP